MTDTSMEQPEHPTAHAVLRLMETALAQRDKIRTLAWLHAEASWWLALDRDEHESAEALHNWSKRVTYLEARVGYLHNTIGELRAENERLRREVEFEALGADTFSGADAIADSVHPAGQP